jgi:hypothetical protein
MSTATTTTTETAGKPFAGGTASVLELRDDGTGNFKHLVKNAKERAKDYPYREDQQDGSEVLKQRLGACVEEFDNSIFDTCSNEKLVNATRKLILESGKKKSNKMATISFMHPKYKDDLEKDDDLKLIYSLLGLAGITRAFMNFYPPGGSFQFHRDEFLNKSGNCKPVADTEKVQSKRYVHKADIGRVTFRACKDDALLKRIDTRSYGMGLDGRGITSMTQHMAEPGPGVKGWDASLVIDCTPAQHDHLQELIKWSLSSGDWKSPHPELGQGIALEGLPSWDFGVYQSERSNKLIDDGSGTGTLERACVVGGRIGGLASVETDGLKMRNGGLASVEVRSQHHIFSPPLAWAKTAEASGLGVHTKPEPRKPWRERNKPRGQYKPKYDPIEFGRGMDVAMSGFFEVGKQLPPHADFACTACW